MGNYFLVFTTFRLIIAVKYFIFAIFIMVALDFVLAVVVVDTFTFIFIVDQHYSVLTVKGTINYFIKIKESEVKTNFFNHYLCIVMWLINYLISYSLIESSL